MGGSYPTWFLKDVLHLFSAYFARNPLPGDISMKYHWQSCGHETATQLPGIPSCTSALVKQDVVTLTSSPKVYKSSWSLRLALTSNPRQQGWPVTRRHFSNKHSTFSVPILVPIRCLTSSPRNIIFKHVTKKQLAICQGYQRARLYRCNRISTLSRHPPELIKICWCLKLSFRRTSQQQGRQLTGVIFRYILQIFSAYITPYPIPGVIGMKEYRQTCG